MRQIQARRAAALRGRREFLQVAAAGAAVYCGLGTAGAPVQASTAGKQKFELGLASYTLREFDLDTALKMTKRVALKHIAFKDFHLPLNSSPEQIAAAVAKVKAAGLDLYGGGVIYMRNEEQVNRAFDYAKAAGMRVIIGAPQPDLLPLIDRKVKEYDIQIAIHNHGPGDKTWPLPQDVYAKVKNLDQRVGLCMDVGHTMRMGVDPADAIKECADRLRDLHLKDVSSATARGGCVEMGRGVIDVPKMLRALVEVGYAGIASFEYEKDSKDPLPGLAETVGYTKGVLAAL